MIIQNAEEVDSGIRADEEGIMHNEIGGMAGKIWKYLNEKGESSLNKLKTGIKAGDRLFHMGVGWLAREDKIKFSAGKKKGGVKVSLK